MVTLLLFRYVETCIDKHSPGFSTSGLLYEIEKFFYYMSLYIGSLLFTNHT